MLTVRERFGPLQGLKMAFVGDGNNVATSLVEAGALTGMEVVIGCPPGYEPRVEGANVVHDPREAVAGADAVYTDVWVSMGREKESAERLRQMDGYQVNAGIVGVAKPGALVMHCLPAYRGKEIDEATFEANADTIFDEAENRLHVQKALMEYLLLGRVKTQGDLWST